MSAPRIFVTPDAVGDESVTVTGDPYHHLAVVLRSNPGDRFRAVVAETATEYLVEITQIIDDTLQGRILESKEPEREATISLTLYQGLPKRRRFKMVLQKCTELGVSRIVPVLSDRSVIRLSDERAKKKVERWRKISEEAARQSGQVMPADIAHPVSFAEAVDDWASSQSAGLFFDETLAGEEGPGLREVLQSMDLNGPLSLFIGPEGGFSPDEAKQAADAGLASVGLGSRILRTETAAIVVCAITMYEAGEMG
ncbi:MAG: RsmE family RNA methyltransferase [Armatimonadota bacterium]